MAEFVTLYPNAIPAMRAGRYRVSLEQTFRSGDGSAIPDVGTIDPVTKHLDVTAPRFSMPGSEVFSVYPPPNAEGAFSTRLPQIVLRRRTLPWERKAGPDQPDECPWIALVVLAEGEANFRRGLRIEEALPADLRARLGVTESGMCDVIEVPERVVTAVFPAQEEVELLCHVREVDVSDTENADQDGRVSVVISNRLPQPGTSYRAYLISLEGQYDVLPKAPTVQDRIGRPLVFQEAELATFVQVVPPAPETRPENVTFSASALAAGAVITDLDAATLAAVSAAQKTGFLLHAVDFSKANDVTIRTTHRFPVLASWDFTCEEGGDFQYLMEHLDVGLMGTAPAGMDPTDARGRTPVAATGHSFLTHVTRRGRSEDSWYRSPLVPKEITRRAPLPFHVADQARRISEDGLEDLSEAAAFEVGRLLALSDQRFLALLHGWLRGTLVEASRRSHLAALIDLGELTATMSRPGRKIDIHLMKSVAADVDGILAPVRDPSGVADLLDPDPARIAAGLGLSPDVVADALSEGVTTLQVDLHAVQAPGIMTFDELVADPAEVVSLAGSLERMKLSLGVKAEVVPVDPGGPDPIVGAGPDGGTVVPVPLVDVQNLSGLVHALWPRSRQRTRRREGG